MKRAGLQRLNYRHKAFCEDYVTHFSPGKAALNAGYKGRTDVIGGTLMSQTLIKEEIARLLKETSKDKVIEKEEVLSILSSIIRGDNLEHMYKSKKEGNITIGYHSYSVKPKLSDRLRAIELMSRILKLMEPEQREVIFDMGKVPTSVIKKLQEENKIEMRNNEC